MSTSKLDQEIAQALDDAKLRGHQDDRIRAGLVRVAHAAAAAAFVGKPTLSDTTLRKAKAAAYNAILRFDRGAGVAGHPVAPSAHEIGTLAEEGVAQARNSWREIREGRGSTAFRALSRPR